MVTLPQNSRKVNILKIVTITRIALGIRFQRALNHHLEIILSQNMTKNVFWASNAQIWKTSYRPSNSENFENFTVIRNILPIRFQQALKHYLHIILSKDMSKNVIWAPNAQIW